LTPEGKTWSYHYDALGRRTRKKGPEGTTRYVWDRDTIIHESKESGECTTWIYQEGDFAPLASIQNGKVHSVINDHLGTPRELVASDGTVSWTGKLGTWGNLQEEKSEGSTCPIRFQGQWFDGESGLHYNNFRYYDPSGKRYISQDPIGLRGGLDLYSYVSNPIRLLDPMGLCEEFPNQLPDELPKELERADALGVKPMSPGDPGFEDMVNSGKVKWVVTTDGELKVIPHSLEGQGEIPHTAASRGEPVLAAGEADIAGTQGEFIGLDIDNHSGHYKPSEESTQVGRDAFGSHGITFPD
jgi:RHS repeat-associated protein